MSGAQEYYDSLLAQGYTPEQATGFTQQHFPGFVPAAPQVAPMEQFQVDQSQVQAVAQQHGVDPNQLAQTARHFDANQDGILQQSELQATAQQMVSTAVPAAPQPMAAPMPAPMAAAPMGQPMGAPMGAPMGGMMPAPQMAMQPSGNSPLGYVAVACIVITLVMSTWGVLGGTWVVPDDDEDMGGIKEAHTDLSDYVFIFDMEDGFGYDGTCEELLDEDGFDKSDFEDDIGGEVSCDGDDMEVVVSLSEMCDESDDDEDTCDAATAGLTAKIILWVAVAVTLGATLLIVFNVFNIGALPINTQKFGMIAGISAGALVAIGVILWMIMMPDMDDSAYGLNVWLTLVGAVTGIVAGILTKIHGNASA